MFMACGLATANDQAASHEQTFVGLPDHVCSQQHSAVEVCRTDTVVTRNKPMQLRLLNANPQACAPYSPLSQSSRESLSSEDGFAIAVDPASGLDTV